MAKRSKINAHNLIKMSENLEDLQALCEKVSRGDIADYTATIYAAIRSSVVFANVPKHKTDLKRVRNDAIIPPYYIGVYYILDEREGETKETDIISYNMITGDIIPNKIADKIRDRDTGAHEKQHLLHASGSPGIYPKFQCNSRAHAHHPVLQVLSITQCATVNGVRRYAVQSKTVVDHAEVTKYTAVDCIDGIFVTLIQDPPRLIKAILELIESNTPIPPTSPHVQKQLLARRPYYGRNGIAHILPMFKFDHAVPARTVPQVPARPVAHASATTRTVAGTPIMPQRVCDASLFDVIDHRTFDRFGTSQHIPTLHAQAVNAALRRCTQLTPMQQARLAQERACAAQAAQAGAGTHTHTSAPAYPPRIIYMAPEDVCDSHTLEEKKGISSLLDDVIRANEEHDQHDVEPDNDHEVEHDTDFDPSGISDNEIATPIYSDNDSNGDGLELPIIESDGPD